MLILVTGGTGYIGSHTVVKLLNAGYDVVILDNLSNSKRQVLDHVETITGKSPRFIEGDIRDTELLENIFTENEIHAVIHFAGLKAVGESVSKPIEYYINNVSGSLNLFAAMKKHDCKKIVFSSSATVYGMNKNVPFREDFPLSTTNPYGATKLMIEDILRDLHKSDNEFSIAILRYFNPIGAHQSGLIGENPNDIPNNLLPYVARVAKGEYEKLMVFGDDYDTVDGTGVRDYIHVEDLAEGHLKALDFIKNKTGAQSFNLGTGKGYSVLQIVKAFEKASSRTVSYEITKRREGDIGTCYADASKAKRMLNWQAKHDIESMCVDAWRFADNHLE